MGRNVSGFHDQEENIMKWTKPKAVEIRCGMEINMYGPAEDDLPPAF
jgi:coenzyme PQQ precursor peptide PqqA